jgi:7-cyano-7-deazaguanine synthase in queuosine biosynthesis
MKIWNILLKESDKDIFDFNVPAEEKKLVINLGLHGTSKSLFSTNVFVELHKHKMKLNDNMNDLLSLALGIYTCDQVVARDIHGFQGWSRHFKLFFPVNKLTQWMPLEENISALLSFLSGDKWEIVFRKKNEVEGKQLELIKNSNPDNIQKVALFSGGMDSFIGAIDELEDKNKLAFVSHYKRGTEGTVQNLLYEKLEKHYGKDTFKAHQFYVQPNQGHIETSKEISSRARSFLFLCLGLSVANTLGSNVELIIPENGLISLNVPLTGTRLSSHSTRTTHPFYLSLFKEIVDALGITNVIKNPYQLLTKGEMMLGCKNHAILKELSPYTVSCSHSEHSRYAGMKPGIQCGYCVPCIIRQAAEYKSKIGGTQYVYDIKNSPPSQKSQSGSDIRAFKLAIKRNESKTKSSTMFDILSSGPLPWENQIALDEYIDVYSRGMTEVADLLK